MNPKTQPLDPSRRKFLGQCCAAVTATGLLSALGQLRQALTTALIVLLVLLGVETLTTLAQPSFLMLGYLYRPYTANTFAGRLTYFW